MVAASSKHVEPSTFDPYHRWLGIPPKHQPPNHYRLLGLELFESDPEVIRDAVEQRMAHVRTYQLSQYVEISQRILNEIAAAKIALLDPARKTAYDARLRQQLQTQPVPKAPPAPPPPTPPTQGGLSQFLGHEATKMGLSPSSPAVEKTDPGAATPFAEIQQQQTPHLLLPLRKQPSPRWRKLLFFAGWKLPPGRGTMVAAAGAAALFFAAVIFYIATNHGTVKIELAEAGANMEVKVDGDTIDIVGLKEPLRLKPGEHDLLVTSGDFETFTNTFAVKRGQETLLRVSLTAKPAAVDGRSQTAPVVGGKTPDTNTRPAENMDMFPFRGARAAASRGSVR